MPLPRAPGAELGDAFEFDELEVERQVDREVRRSAKNYVLNGIAYDESDDTLLVTGKLWSAMYRILRAQ